MRKLLLAFPLIMLCSEVFAGGSSSKAKFLEQYQYRRASTTSTTSEASALDTNPLIKSIEENNLEQFNTTLATSKLKKNIKKEAFLFAFLQRKSDFVEALLKNGTNKVEFKTKETGCCCPSVPDALDIFLTESLAIVFNDAITKKQENILCSYPLHNTSNKNEPHKIASFSNKHYLAGSKLEKILSIFIESNNLKGIKKYYHLLNNDSWDNKNWFEDENGNSLHLFIRAIELKRNEIAKHIYQKFASYYNGFGNSCWLFKFAFQKDNRDMAKFILKNATPNELADIAKSANSINEQSLILEFKPNLAIYFRTQNPVINVD